MNTTAQSQPSLSKKGFTLVELILVMGIMGVLLTLSSILLMDLIPKTSLTVTVERLVADLRYQQLMTMSGHTEQVGVGQNYGVYFATDKYILFGGDTYDSDNSSNFQQVVDAGLGIETGFVESQVVFNRASGEILNYVPDEDWVKVTDSITGREVTIKLNKYGVVTDETE
ncbi:MAG TPA: prepilin-type N-terminal cleavage/methylation domain-containing protein [Candidatus Woesebacteria bacterium]|nr:prepilin-type N-terminal cleavage/methylation domain-containing protein [Candidatus Woesebacteria bacterium]